MFISTKSDGQIFVNLRKKRIEKKMKIFSPLMHYPLCPSFSDFVFVFFFSFSLSETHMSLLFHFLVHFSLETIYFVPVSISFIQIEYSLNICHFSKFFKNPVFRFHSKPVRRLEFRKILRLSRNLTKLS